MSGHDFEALVRLTAKDGSVLALPGDSCEKVPEVSLGWLAAKGSIKKRGPGSGPKKKGRLTSMFGGVPDTPLTTPLPPAVRDDTGDPKRRSEEE